MDARHFDRIARALSRSGPRRGALTVLAALPLIGSLAAFLGNEEADARGRDKGRRKKQRPGNGRPRGQERDGTPRTRRDDGDPGGKRGQRRQKTRKPKQQPPAGAEAAPGTCCSSGTCTPGPGKNLGKCCYKGQNLAGKSFKGANLGHANFSGAILTNANFGGANLGQTCFVDADITGVNFAGTNTGSAIFCRTRTNSGEDSSGCANGTPCCPTCDTAHPCGQGQRCCNGRCVAGNCCGNGEQSTCGAGEICCANVCSAGECCRAADCATRVCETKACVGFACAHEPVSGNAGSGCQTVCCENAQGDPVCCDAGVAACAANGQCCAPISRCLAGACGSIPNGCGGTIPCPACGGGLVCVDGACRPCTAAGQCAAGQVCCAGTCQSGDCCPTTGANAGRAERCNANQRCCADGCRNLTTPANCGACGNACPATAPNCCLVEGQPVCRQCCDNGQCTDPSRPFCVTGQCAQCTSGDTCPFSICQNPTCADGVCGIDTDPDGTTCRPFGQDRGVCCSGVCRRGAECCNATQCTNPGRPFCVQGRCDQCAVDGDCPAPPCQRPVCDFINGQCTTINLNGGVCTLPDGGEGICRDGSCS